MADSTIVRWDSRSVWHLQCGICTPAGPCRSVCSAAQGTTISGALPPSTGLLDLHGREHMQTVMMWQRQQQRKGQVLVTPACTGKGRVGLQEAPCSVRLLKVQANIGCS